jgi:hypothetical protein
MRRRRGGLVPADCKGFQPFLEPPTASGLNGAKTGCLRLVREGMSAAELDRACAAQPWFGPQHRAATHQACLGFQRPPPGLDCKSTPDNINCYLQKHPQACNYLEHPAWSQCMNELYITCLERAPAPINVPSLRMSDLDRTRALWVTDPSHVPRGSPNPYVTQNEVCHWYQHTGQWPLAPASLPKAPAVPKGGGRLCLQPHHPACSICGRASRERFT